MAIPDLAERLDRVRVLRHEYEDAVDKTLTAPYSWEAALNAAKLYINSIEGIFAKMVLEEPA